MADCDASVLSVSKSRLVGQVRVSGAKNSALKLLCASLLTDQPVELHNYPSTILDARVQQQMISALGKDCVVTENQVRISEPHELQSKLEWSDRSVRTSLLMLGAMLARAGTARVPLPGGCAIGDSGRGFDLHVAVLEQLGARIEVHDDGTISGTSDGKLVGADIHLPIRSTGATENAILAACLAKGTTRIWNPHVRPEIRDLVSLLEKMGARIKVHGQQSIEIHGVDQLYGATHQVIPDNIEALTWLVGAVITDGEVEILDFPFDHLEVPLVFLRESGAKLHRGDSTLIVRRGACFPLEVSTGPYPGINSDMQPLFAVYGACAVGTSKFIDLRFPGRYRYAEELNKMGLKTSVQENVLNVHGGPLNGAGVRATDLRAGVALVLAGMTATGTTHVHDAWQISRGYDGFTQKCRSLGARVYSTD